jgi:eukaryotic-like serine/threonine-protein kinase
VQPQQISKYRITKELGKGSMGVVYEGQPAGGGPPVAIKVFFPDTKLTPEETSTLLDRFTREGASLRRVQHPNVVGVLEVGGEAGMEFIVMDKLQGYNLKELLAMGTRFTLAETFDITLQLLSGLAACHAVGIVHRDIKAANVVRAPGGEIMLTDFGIARIVTDQTLTRAGTIVGTPNYMSPEQIRGEEVDARTDIFSTGVLMYELLTGVKPFDGPDMAAIMYNVTHVHPPSPRFYNSALPEELDSIVYIALAKNLHERYAGAEDFALALRNLEHALHYRDDTESILSALPAAPDMDAALALGPSSGSPGAMPTGTGAGRASLPSGNSAADAALQLGGGFIQLGALYCVDCGMQNSADSDFCVRCMRPLLKRDTVDRLAAQKAQLLSRGRRGDWWFMTCLSILIAATAILILYLFFRDSMR